MNDLIPLAAIIFASGVIVGAFGITLLDIRASWREMKGTK